MEQVLIHEVFRYLDLKDRNTVCLLNKEMYGKLRPLTPPLNAIKKKQCLHRELLKVTASIHSRIAWYMGNKVPLLRFKIMRFQRKGEKDEYDHLTYVSCQHPHHMMKSYGDKHPYIWLITPV